MCFQIEVQMGDHPLSAKDAVFEANCAVKMGEALVVASHKVNVTRTEDAVARMTEERGNIVVDIEQTLPADTLYNAT